MVGHPGNQVWFLVEGNSTGRKHLKCLLDLAYFEIQHRAVAFTAVSFWNVKHQPHAAAIEKREIWKLKKKFQPYQIPVERDRSINIRDGKRYLAQLTKLKIGCG